MNFVKDCVAAISLVNTVVGYSIENFGHKSYVPPSGCNPGDDCYTYEENYGSDSYVPPSWCNPGDACYTDSDFGSASYGDSSYVPPSHGYGGYGYDAYGSNSYVGYG